MIILFSIIWTIPKIDWILSIFIEECSEILSYGYWLQLIRVNCKIKYSLYQMNSISNNNDVEYFRNLDSLVYYISYGK